MTNPLRTAADAKYGSPTKGKVVSTEVNPLEKYAGDSTKVTEKKVTVDKTSLREQADSKYGSPSKPLVKKSVEAPSPATPDSFKGQTISKAPEKRGIDAVLSKIGDFADKHNLPFFSKTKDIVAKDQVVSGLTQTINDRPYYELGIKLGLDKTVVPEYPEGVTAESFKVPGTDIYKQQAIIDGAKELARQNGAQEPEKIDPEFIKENLDAITKEMGIRTTPTVTEFNSIVVTGVLGVGIAGPLLTRFLPTLVKTGAGLAGFEALNAAERKIYEISTGKSQSTVDLLKNKYNLPSESVGLLELVDFVAKGAVLHGIYKKSPGLIDAFTKQTITKYNLPKNVYFTPEAVRSVFTTDGSKITAEGNDFVKSLGLKGESLRDAINNGVTITIPGEKLVTIADKPYWAKLKTKLGFEPVSNTTVTPDGKTSQGPEMRENRLLEAGNDANVVPGAFEPVKTTEISKFEPTPEIKSVLSEKITPSLLERINALTPEESAAFGRGLVGQINEALGTKLSEKDLSVPDTVQFFKDSHSDGRPAQFNSKTGQVEVFLPSLMKDLELLSKGGEIEAHPDSVHTTVFKMEEGETFPQLANRYIREVILHEEGHRYTINDFKTEVDAIKSELNDAKRRGDKKAEVEALKKKADIEQRIEDAANQFVKDNRAGLEEEVFGGTRRREVKTELQKTIDDRISSSEANNKKVVRDEKTTLKIRLRDVARGAKEGFTAGKREATERISKQTENKKENEQTQLERKIELDRLKQRIKDRTRENIKVSKIKTRHEIAVEKIKDRKSTIEERKQAAIDYVQIVPKDERWKFIKEINNLSSEKDFLNVIERITRTSKASERKTLILEIRDRLKYATVKSKDGRPKPKISVERQRTIDLIKKTQSEYEARAKAMRDAGNKEASAYDLARADIQKKISEWRTANPDAGQVPIEIVKENDLLRMVGIKDMTVKQLSETLSSIESIIETGKTERELKRFNAETDKIVFRDTGLQILTGGREIPSSKMGIRQEKIETTRMGKLLENIRSGKTYLVDAWEEVLDDVSKFDKGTGPYESKISEFGRGIKDARTSSYKGEKQMFNKLNEAVIEIYKIPEEEVLGHLAEMREMVELGKIKLSDGTVKEFTLSRAQAIKYSMLFEDATLDATFEKQGWDANVKNKILSILTKEDLEMRDWALGTFYREYYDRINKVYAEDTGADLPFNQNYSPLYRDIDGTIPESVLMAQEGVKYATARTGSLKNRVDNTIEVKPVDVFSEMFGHVTKMEHYISHQKFLNEARAFFGNKEVRRAIEELHGKSKLKFIDNALNDFARDGVAREKIVAGVDSLRINTTRAILGLNKNVALKQLSGVFNYMIEIDTVPFIKGVTSFWVNPIQNAKFIADSSAIYRDRYEQGWERDVQAALRRGYDKAIAKEQNVSEFLFILTRNADRLSVTPGMYAAYLDSIKKGKSPEEAMKYAEDVTERVQEASSLDTLSEVQRGGSWAKLFTMLQGQQVKFLRIMANSARNFQYGRGSRTRNAKRFLYAWVLAPLIYSLWANSVATSDKYKKSGKELVTRALLGPITYIPATGAVAQSLIDRAFGENFDYTPSAAFSAVDDLLKSIDNFYQGDLIDAVTYIADAAGKLKGYPTTLITKPIRNAQKEEANKSGTVSF